MLSVKQQQQQQAKKKTNKNLNQPNKNPIIINLVWIELKKRMNGCHVQVCLCIENEDLFQK